MGYQGWHLWKTRNLYNKKAPKHTCHFPKILPYTGNAIFKRYLAIFSKRENWPFRRISFGNPFWLLLNSNFRALSQFTDLLAVHGHNLFRLHIHIPVPACPELALFHLVRSAQHDEGDPLARMLLRVLLAHLVQLLLHRLWEGQEIFCGFVNILKISTSCLISLGCCVKFFHALFSHFPHFRVHHVRLDQDDRHRDALHAALFGHRRHRIAFLWESRFFMVFITIPTLEL